MNGLKEVLDLRLGSGIQITLSGKAFDDRQAKKGDESGVRAPEMILL
jgi:hypothetical protein